MKFYTKIIVENLARIFRAKLILELVHDTKT